VTAVDFNYVRQAIIGGKSVDKVYAGDTLVWEYLDGGVKAPSNVMARYEANESYTVLMSWDVPSTNHGVTIANYFITYIRDGRNPVFLSYAPSNSLEFTLNQYFPTGKYRFGVRALTNIGTGPVGYSNTIWKS